LTTANIGVRNSNTILPYAAATKETKWIRVTDASHITITGTGFTSSTIRGAYIKASADSNNVWSLEFNVDVTKAAGTGARTSATLTFASPYAVVFRNLTQFFQAVSAFDDSTALAITAEANPNASTVSIAHASSDIAQYSLSGRCILESEPTWAAANMEGALPVDVYIPPASASVAGIVDTSAQSFAGNKTFNDGVKLDDAEGQSTLGYYKTLEHTTTFTTNGTSPTPSGSLTLKLARVGRVVTMQVPTISVSNSGTGTPRIVSASTVLPDTGFRPTTAAAAMVITNDNGGYTNGVYGICIVNNDGTIEIYRNVNNDFFTTSTACGAFQFTLSWCV